MTGPDEYTAIADNNIYTNLAARKNLRDAAAICERLPRRRPVARRRRGGDGRLARRGGGDDDPLRRRARASTRNRRRSPATRRWDFEATPPESYPLFLHHPYFDIYRKQVVKQADLVLALYLFGDAFDAGEKARDFAYYEELTVRDSSLSACTQAVIAAEVGHLDLAFEYMVEAALMDLDDLEHNTRDGVHMASLAGAWIATVAGFGGMRDHGGRLTFAPRLAQQLSSLLLPPHVPRLGGRGPGRPRRGELRARQGRGARDRPPRRADRARSRRERHAPDPADRCRAAPRAPGGS